MWNLKDRNKIVGTQDKVNSFKKHIKAMHHIKPRIKFQEPWRPSFSLSKFNNKYYRISTMQLLRQNETLFGNLTRICDDKKVSTFLQIPRTIPSNSEAFKCFRRRERDRQRLTVQKQNEKILSKIKCINSTYSKRNYDKQWKQANIYKLSITKKQLNPDFYQLAKQSFFEENSCSRLPYSKNTQSEVTDRPKTAFPR